jgi:hypothetical protein
VIGVAHSRQVYIELAQEAQGADTGVGTGAGAANDIVNVKSVWNRSEFGKSKITHPNHNFYTFPATNLQQHIYT